jgi:predicted RNA-binding Zn-ribbon protein involved in translation (DUF1610 family)
MRIKWKVLFCMLGLPLTMSVAALLSDNPNVHSATLIGTLILIVWWGATLKCPKCGKPIIRRWKTNSSRCPSCHTAYTDSTNPN